MRDGIFVSDDLMEVINSTDSINNKFGSLKLSNLPTSPTGLPTGSVWVSGSKKDASTNNVNCGTLMIVI